MTGEPGDKDKQRIAFALERYTRAVHAMQSGVAMDMELGSTDTTPKHLRIGVNSAHVNAAALAELLIARGVITLADYHEALADAAEREQRLYEERLGAALGSKVTLK